MNNSEKVNEEAWISQMKSNAEALLPPAHLKRKIMEQIDMRNDNGDVLASVRVDTFQPSDPMDAIIQQLKPGMGKAIYIAGQGDRAVSQQTNYEAVLWPDSLEQLFQQAAPWNPPLPLEAELRRIEVYYGFDNVTEEEREAMIAESEQQGKSVVVRDLRPNTDIVGVRLLYDKADRSFECRLFGTTKSRIHVPDMEQQTIERLRIHGQEAVYLESEEMRRLIWATEHPQAPRAVQYELLAEHGDREWLLEIANTIPLV
ncbi:hypothetical protein [Paenibacillus radicis (ex Gao et al. 2016)]|uniref:Uncharacterized protein n=1 Tax=Paenibacillus radicis (ex Gao et al. 2016) TaxID=1737354 RepID=A0A917HGA3_9BACL|nr:hypothetical protein [Paenibacillus radicis (ex Gao et al. 2016)]GGG77539.1 hypothetical protein GCM10010918_37800 [Paenibacillus radicis (ex Gao et al. 2016)]